jgi:hypothetical protein
MRLKFLSFSNITLLVALSLSSVAAWYSIIGLTAIFAGAVIPVIIMGGILEIGKITTTVWLHKYWHRASWLLKLYLVPAVIALALLTSMGIFGFLSKAHMDSGLVSGDVQAKLSLYDEKIKTQRDNIELARKALTQMDNQVDQRLSRGDSETSAERAVQIRRQQSGERVKLQKDISEAQKEIAKLNEERAPIAAENRKVEAEVGPIKYIAALIYGDTSDSNTLESAVRWVIILLVVVFDPLAIALVLAANASKEWDKEEPVKDEPVYEPDDGPLTDKQLVQVEETAKEDLPAGELITKSELLPDEPIECHKCNTILVDAPGIGLFCPNKQCDVIDNIEGVVWKFVAPEPIAQPEKTLAELHPYLYQPFNHFKELAPLVHKPEVIVEPTVDQTVTADNIEIVTDGVTVEKKAPEKLYKESEGDYVLYDGKSIHIDALKSLHPELFRLSPDTAGISTGFGIKFPDQSRKGDVFTRVDVLPNRVFKFDGARWIEVNKNQSDTYLHDQKYIQYLVEKLEKGEYDVELLSDNERAQIEQHLQNQKS